MFEEKQAMASQFQLDILIVEDSLSFALELETLLVELDYNIAGRVDNSAEALELIYAKEPDLILMDIDIKGQLNGLEIGERIKHLQIPILFITSLGTDAHYETAQKSNMVGFLVKPVEKYTLRSAIQLAIQNALGGPIDTPQTDENLTEHFIAKDCIFFKKSGTYHKVQIDDILVIQSDDNYIKVSDADGNTFLVRMPINQISQLLPSGKFLRVHRSFVVQIDKIDTINFQQGTLKVSGNEVPISRSRRQELEAVIKKLE